MNVRARFEGRGWRAPTALLVSLAGLGLAAFLTYGHYFDQGAITNTCPGDVGGAGGVVNCGLVTTSKWSMILGLPVALYGLLFFVFMVAVNLPQAWRTPSVWVARLRLWATVLGLVFVVYLVGVEALALHKLCVYCTGVHVLTFALFLVVATGWQDTGWSRFVAAYDAAKEGRDTEEGDPDGDAEGSAEPLAVPFPASRRAPRAPRSERRRAAAGR